MRGSQATSCGAFAETCVRQDVGDLGVIGTGRHSQHLAEQPAEDGVRRGGLVLLAGDDHDPDVLDRRQQLGDQPGLADPGGTHDVDELSPARADVGQRPRQHGHLVVAPDQRQRCARSLAVAQERADLDGPDGTRLALDEERRQLGGAEERVRPRDHLRGGQHLSGKGLAHHPCGEVDRVSLDRERTPERRPEVAREHVSAVDADAQGEAPGTVQHLPGDTQHPLLVVVGAARSAGGEHDLAAVAVDVGLEEGDVVVGAGVLDVAHDVVERLGEGARPLRGEQRIGAGELHEGHGDQAVLRLDGAAEQVGPDRGRQHVRRSQSSGGGLLDGHRVDGRREPQQPAPGRGPRPGPGGRAAPPSWG